MRAKLGTLNEVVANFRTGLEPPLGDQSSTTVRPTDRCASCSSRALPAFQQATCRPTNGRIRPSVPLRRRPPAPYRVRTTLSAPVSAARAKTS